MKPENWTPKTRDAVEVLAQKDGFLVSSSGGIRWTSQGLKKMRARFAAAGIDIRSLRTLEQYLQARMAIDPLLDHELVRLARGRGPITDERKLLMAVVDGSEVQARQLEFKLKNRKPRSS
jgi:hypothetical protein